MDKVFIRLGEISVEFPEGVTLNLSTFEIVKSGWVVTLPGAQNFSGDDAIVRALEVAINTSRVISGWTLEDQIFWDVVMVFEEEAIATFAARKTDQAMIYQIETGLVKWLI